MITLSCVVVTHAQVLLPSPTVINGTPVKPNDPSSYANLFDNNLGTFYSGNDGGVNTFLVFDFGSSTTISRFWMKQRNDTARVATSDLLFSDTTDFSSPIATYHLTHTVNPYGAENTFDFTPVTARYVYWDVTSLPSGGTLAVGAVEMDFYTTAIPEPSACAALAGLAALGFAVWRRRQPMRTR